MFLIIIMVFDIIEIISLRDEVTMIWRMKSFF